MSRLHRRLASSTQLERWRRQVLDRDSWTCRHCGRYGHHADHVVALQHGGAALDVANGQCLCARCHRLKTATENGEVAGRDEWRAFAAELLD